MTKHYKNLQLVTAMMSGEIYLAHMNKSGFMGERRRVITDECLRATTEWFMANKKSGFRFESVRENEHPHLFYTGDKNKAKRIIKILKESD